MGGGKTSTSTTTYNYDPVASQKAAEVAERQQAMAEEQWEYYKRVFQPYEQELMAANRSLLPGQVAYSAATTQERLRDIERARPAVEKFYDMAIQGVQPRYQEVMGAAQADIAQGFDASTQALKRELARMGVDPNSGALISALKDTALQRAKAIGSARTQARMLERDRSENLTFNRLGQALNARLGLPVAGTMGGYSVSDPTRTSTALYGNASSVLGQLASRPLSQTTKTSTSGGGFGTFLGDLAGTGLGIAGMKWVLGG